jgi:hypothetical protein
MTKSLPVAFALSVVSAMCALADAETEFDVRFRQAATEWLSGLPAADAAACIRPFDAPARWAMQYTGGRREGVQIGSLSPAAREGLEAMMRMVLSERGWEQAQAIAAQDGPAGLGKYYVTFFGDPRSGDFAWRIAEHHLTIIHLGLEKGAINEFGPILLGSDPPVVWTGEEDLLLALWKALGDQAAATSVPGRGIASEPMAAGVGVAVPSLSETARKALEAVWQSRMGFFSEAVRARISRLVEARGGVDKMRMAFYNEPADKRCAEGGRWDWKLAGESTLLDLETSRKHVHLSLWIR